MAIVTSYNDMLSAHQPYETYPPELKQAVRKAGGVAQVAGGVPAMCDGITQGRAGMELSLYSRDVIAMSTAIALSHDMFDASLLLGVCDKIVPGLFIGALHFGHLPAIFVPAGPMASGLPNKVKARTRQLFAEGKVGREELLDAEAKSYHSPGTCTFYGTANSNQALMEVMGLHLPGSTFVNPHTELRHALTQAAGRRAVEITAHGAEYTPIGELVDEKSIVNACVALLATGGSTNHTLHLVAMAAAAGIVLTWDDLACLSEVVPSLTKIYPNGQADVNHFRDAGGMQVLIGDLLDEGLLHGDVMTVAGPGLDRYREAPELVDGELVWAPVTGGSKDLDVLRPAADPFSADGGIHMVEGNLGRAVSKVSAVKPEHLVIEAPAKVFHDQLDLLKAFEAGELDGQDFVAVIRYQGPQRERHARAAQAHLAAGGAARQGPAGGDRHRRPHVGRVGQGAGGHPSVARGGRRRADRAGPRRRRDQAGLGGGHAGAAGAGRGAGPPHARGPAAERRAVGRHGTGAVRRLPPDGGARRAGRRHLRGERRRVAAPRPRPGLPRRGGLVPPRDGRAGRRAGPVTGYLPVRCSVSVWRALNAPEPVRPHHPAWGNVNDRRILRCMASDLDAAPNAGGIRECL
ncbi:hypothetical protein GCM10020220_058770 [Nonomuraea rubra]